MLYLTGLDEKIDGYKIVVYDSDDNTIEYVDSESIIKAYESGIKF